MFVGKMGRSCQACSAICPSVVAFGGRKGISLFPLLDWWFPLKPPFRGPSTCPLSRRQALLEEICFGLQFSFSREGAQPEPQEWDGPVPEEAPMQPVSPYGVSKAGASRGLFQQPTAFRDVELLQLLGTGH